MLVPSILLFVSLTGDLVALLRPDALDLLLLSGPTSIASLVLLVQSWRCRAGPAPTGSARPRVVVDGSNVMHWDAKTVRLSVVREVLLRLSAEGFDPGVVFYANAGYLIGGRYLSDRAFARLLGLPVDRVLVAPRGTPADPLILTAARYFGARIVSSDRFRDWAAEFPEVCELVPFSCTGFRHC